jgi:type I restriction enzyme S subunit
MSYKSRPISSFCKTGSGGTPSRSKLARYYSGTIPWVKSGELAGKVISQTEEHITEVAVAESSAKIVQPGAILVAMYGATVGRVALLGITAATNQAVCHIVPDQSVCHVGYLFHCLRSKLQEFLSKRVGGAQPNISQAIIRDTNVPIPPLPEQKRIAAILDKADALREKRRQTIAKLETLPQSIFIDMFGDPISNPRRWETCLLGDAVETIDSGWSPVCLDRPANSIDEWGVLKLGAVTTCEYKESENKALPNDLSPKPELEVKEGDLLFSRKNTYDLVAACALVLSTRPNLMLSDLIFRLRLKKDGGINPEYLWCLLTSPNKRRQVQSLASGSAGSMPNISKARLRTLSIAMPPIELQEKFSLQLRKIYDLKLLLLNTSSRSDDLFKSLQQRAFNGGLLADKPELQQVN